MSRDRDGGWAWVVLCACATCVMLTSGLAAIASLMQKVLLDDLTEDVVAVSWITSMFASLLQLAGPVTGVVCSVFSCRVSIMAGGILLVIGLFVSSFCQDVFGLILALGLCSGLGLGLIYSAAIVMVSLSFVRYRPVATGSVLAAGGVGIMVIPVLCRFMLKVHSWRQMLAILSFCSAQLVVAGALLFPVTDPDRLPNSKRGTRLLKTPKRTIPASPDTQRRSKISVSSQDSQSNSCREIHTPDTAEGIHIHQDEHTHSGEDIWLNSQCLVGNETNITTVNPMQNNTAAEKNRDDTETVCCKTELLCAPDQEPGPSDKKEKTAFLSASAVSLFVSPITSHIEIRPERTWREKLALLINPCVIILCLQLFLTNASTGIILVHYAKFCLQMGSDLDTVVLAFAGDGLSLVLARLLIGVLAQDSRVDSLLVYVGLNFVAAFCKTASPFVAVNGNIQVLMLACLGAYSGGAYSVLTEVTIQCTGTDSLSLVFGLEMIFAGAGYLVAPPIAAVLVAPTGSYTYVMLLAGVLEILASFVAMTLSLARPVWKPADCQHTIEVELLSSADIKLKETAS